jgi:hypothetical protein
MRIMILFMGIAGIFLLSISCQQDLSIKESSFSKSLVTGKYILEAKEGWWNWCMAPIYDEEGKLHVFMSTIPDTKILMLFITRENFI